MKHLLLTTIAAVVLVGCGESQHVKDAKLARAASQGKIKEVKKYLAAGANVDARRALHEAVDRGHKEVVELLIATSADVNAKNQWGRTPLHQAAVRGRKEIVELLLANGADVNAKGDSGGAPLLSARTVEIAELLIANGADVNAKNDEGETPLHRATTRGKKSLTRLLINAGADVNAKDGTGRTPLHWAAWVGHKEIAELLITAGSDVNAKDGDGDTPLDEAVSEGEKETAYLLRKNGGKHGTVHSAVGGGDVEAVKEFLAADADVNAKRYGWTPLCEAAINGHKEIAELLIANGADVNAKDDRGWTPLHLAASGGHKEIAELLWVELLVL